MEKSQLIKIVSKVYEPAIDPEKAWSSYTNFILLFFEGDPETIDYLLTICELGQKERLLLRHKIAEQGYELTPNELNQYILLIMIALTEYINIREFDAN